MTEAAVSFAGNLTEDPEVRYTDGGIARAMFRVAVMGRLQQRSWTAEDGSARSAVEVVRNHLAEIRDETGYSVPAGVADEIASLVERLR
jgi:single-stranded DNA-binding protein